MLELVEHDLGDHDHIYLVPLSDFHVGDKRFDGDKLQGYIDWIRERPNAYSFLNGDLMDAITVSSVGNIYDADMTPNDQLKYVKRALEPIGDRVLGVVEGNHERRISTKTGIDVSEMIAEHLGAPYSREMMALKLRFGQGRNGKPMVYTLLYTHGTGGGRTQGGKSNALARMGLIGLFDVYSIAHIHHMSTFQQVFMVPDLQNGQIMERKLTFVSSGSYVRYGGYAAEKMYSPVKLGSPRVRMSGRSRDVHVSI